MRQAKAIKWKPTSAVGSRSSSLGRRRKRAVQATDRSTALLSLSKGPRQQHEAASGRQRGEPHGSGLGTTCSVVEHANAWLLANKRLDRRNDRLSIIIDALLTTACIFVIANRLTD
jgi:hypothetical protein